MKKLATISFALLLTSACSVGNFQQKIEVQKSSKASEVRLATNSEFNMLQNRGSVKSDEKLYIANLGTKDGGQFLVKFDFNNFKTKNSVNGTPAKIASDVSSLDVFLFRLSPSFDSGVSKDPFGPSSSNLYWSRNGIAKNGSSVNFLFTGIPSNTDFNTEAYWVGVVARDSGNNIISKSGTNWTGITGTYAGFNLSSTGVGVLPNLTVTNTMPLSVSVNLLDAIGAQLDAEVNINSGSPSLPSVGASPYVVPMP